MQRGEVAVRDSILISYSDGEQLKREVNSQIDETSESIFCNDSQTDGIVSGICVGSQLIQTCEFDKQGFSCLGLD